ncbi:MULTISPECIES: cyclase family protein [Microbacterium]|jgi:kynurenine formamidase|uniref:cyclase family protein n=1 Tax=Microbacterium TaxID=33882 RepID=UPI001D17ACEE|nr:cyclase family protein [Microbacterium testaceum]MCC4250180.1 cyclase family protein [Microbacterium testaceum]
MGQTIIDLTLVIEEGMPGHATHGRTPVRLAGSLNHWAYAATERRNPYDGRRLSFQNEQWVLNGNTGTHMDAPWHANPDTMLSAERVPIECGFGPAVWLDCTAACTPRGVITPELLEAAEAASGERIQRGDIVLLHTGWSRFITSDKERYLTEHPGLSKEAGEWLRAKGIRTLGIDTPTPETPEGGYSAPIHMNFLRPESLGLQPDDFVAIIENLVNIDRITTHRFQFIGMPLPLSGSSASPIRAIAVVDT